MNFSVWICLYGSCPLIPSLMGNYPLMGIHPLMGFRQNWGVWHLLTLRYLTVRWMWKIWLWCLILDLPRMRLEFVILFRLVVVLMML
jgi:hypothetical protein